MYEVRENINKITSVYSNAQDKQVHNTGILIFIDNNYVSSADIFCGSNTTRRQLVQIYTYGFGYQKCPFLMHYRVLHFI
jgi:hypothetical protein